MKFQYYQELLDSNKKKGLTSLKLDNVREVLPSIDLEELLCRQMAVRQVVGDLDL